MLSHQLLELFPLLLRQYNDRLVSLTFHRLALSRLLFGLKSGEPLQLTKVPQLLPHQHFRNSRSQRHQRAVRPVLLVTVFFDTENVVPASTTSLPFVTRSVAKNQFGVVEDAISVILSVALSLNTV